MTRASLTWTSGRTAHTARPVRAALALAAAAALTLGACSSGTSNTPPDSPDTSAAPTAQQGVDAPANGGELLAAYDLDGKDAKQIIEQLDTMAKADRPADLIASIRTDEIVLRDRNDETVQTTVPMPADEFYLSFAPYVSQTHDCFYHSLTTCVGEQQNEDVHVTITQDDGTVLVDEDATTFDNGFYGVWLPRDIKATLKVEVAGKSASATIGTGPEDLTCLTTLPLT